MNMIVYVQVNGSKLKRKDVGGDYSNVLCISYLNFTLSFSTSRVNMSLSLHGLVASSGTDSLLSSALDAVCGALGLLLGAGGQVGGVGFGLLDLA